MPTVLIQFQIVAILVLRSRIPILAQTSFDWPAGQWIKANTHQYGYFRVDYPKENWVALAKALEANPKVNIRINNIV